MILPSRRWYTVAAGLAVIAPFALLRPEATVVLVIADLLWVIAFLIDVFRAAAIDLATFPVTREAPPAFSVGRPLPVTYRWKNAIGRSLRFRIREEFPSPFEVPHDPERTLTVPANSSAVETLELVPLRRGRATAGRLHLRLLAPWGLAWRQAKRELPWSVTVYPNLRNAVGSSRVDLQACKLEYSIVSPK